MDWIQGVTECWIIGPQCKLSWEAWAAAGATFTAISSIFLAVRAERRSSMDIKTRSRAVLTLATSHLVRTKADLERIKSLAEHQLLEETLDASEMNLRSRVWGDVHRYQELAMLTSPQPNSRLIELVGHIVATAEGVQRLTERTQQDILVMRDEDSRITQYQQIERHSAMALSISDAIIKAYTALEL